MFHLKRTILREVTINESLDIEKLFLNLQKFRIYRSH